MKPAFLLLGLAYLLGTALQHIFLKAGLLDGGNLKAWSIGVGCVALGLSILSGLRASWHRLLASNRFSVPVLIVLTILSIAGTLILQGQPEGFLVQAYGSALQYIRMFFLDDIFHSFGFAVVMGLGAGGLFLVIIRKRRLNARYLGSLGAHLGLLLVLLGAAVGNVWGLKGQLNLNSGKSSDHFLVPTGTGRMAKHPLGFTLRLDEFRLLHYEKAYRLAVFDVSDREEKLLISVDPGGAEREGLSVYGVEVLDYWPDHFQNTVVKPVASAGKSKLAALGLAAADRPKDMVWIFDDSDGFPVGDSRLVFIWSTSQAENLLKTLGSTEVKSPHQLLIGGKEYDVEEGKSYPLPDGKHRVEVARLFMDFVMDAQSRTPQDRSDKPNNPAVELQIKDSSGNPAGRQYLFAKYPDFHGRQNPLLGGVEYRYLGGPATAPIGWIAVGQSGELWKISKDQIESRQEMVFGKTIQLGELAAEVRGLHESVERSFLDGSLSDQANNPVVHLRHGRQEAWIALKRPIRLSGDRALALIPKGGDSVRDYLSRVSVYRQERKVLSSTIEVNHPLDYGGYHIYQADYRPDDPTFSGFQVVSDPGLWIVYMGFAVNFLGVVWVVFVPPLLRRRKRSEAG